MGIESACPVDAQCGGCNRVGVSYAEQLVAKDEAMDALFASLSDAVPEGVPSPLPILGMESPYHYRDKVTSPFAPGRKLDARGQGARGRAAEGKKPKKNGKTAGGRRGLDREVLTGMYQAGTHKLVCTDCCLIENEQGNAVIRAIRAMMQRYGIPPYKEDTGAGFMRHAVVRVGHESGEVLVTLVTNGREFPGSKQFCRELVKRCPFVTTVVQNVNTRQTNVILGTEEHTLYGPGFILDTLCGLSFRVSSQSFYQVNCAQTEVLYNTAIDFALEGFVHNKGADPECSADALQAANEAPYAGDQGKPGKASEQPRETAPENAVRADAAGVTVIDAFCGTGTIGLVAARRGAARVIGVESVGKAVADARQNARHNGIGNAAFVTADAGEFMLALAGRPVGPQTEKAVAEAVGDAPIDPERTVLMLDPPRAGSSEDFLRATCALSPVRIVYVSCNPNTQVRDVRYLLRHGYRLDRIQPVDMFPHTDHVETVVLLSKGFAKR